MPLMSLDIPTENSQHDLTPPDLNVNESQAVNSNLVVLSENKEILI